MFYAKVDAHLVARELEHPRAIIGDGDISQITCMWHDVSVRRRYSHWSSLGVMYRTVQRIFMTAGRPEHLSILGLARAWIMDVNGVITGLQPLGLYRDRHDTIAFDDMGGADLFTFRILDDDIGFGLWKLLRCSVLGHNQRSAREGDNSCDHNAQHRMSNGPQ